MKHEGILIVVSGFSGAGKGTLMKRLVSKYENYALSISMTTRGKRAGETDGVSYFFVDRPTFEETLARDGLIEHAVYCGNYYGTPRDYVEEQMACGRDVILEIEIQGALKIRERYPNSLLLFVMPPSIQELQARLGKRGTETPDVIRARLQRAAQEAEGIEAYDFIVVNDDLDACMEQIHEIVRAAHLRPGCNKEFINQLKGELQALVKGEK